MEWQIWHMNSANSLPGASSPLPLAVLSASPLSSTPPASLVYRRISSRVFPSLVATSSRRFTPPTT